MKCYYLVGYHGCGKTTQANKLEAEHPIFNFIGGKPGLDAICLLYTSDAADE